MDQISGHALGRRVGASDKQSVSFLSVFEAGLCFALLYGANLYFSTNANINDPVVPMWWPVTKDAILTTLFGYLVFSLYAWRSAPLPLILTIAFAVFTGAFCLVLFGISAATVTFTKNLVLYFAGGALLGVVIAERSVPSELGFRICRAILISIVVGIACLLLPVQSLDERLYGTYGNPTSFSFAVFVALVLVTALRPKWESIAASCVIGAIYVMTGSISVILAAGVFFILLSAAELLKGGSITRYAGHLAAIPASIAAVGPILQHLHLPVFGYERLVSLLTSDSIRVRLIAFVLEGDGRYHRYDSFLLGLYKNFGPLPLLMYSAIIGSLIWQYSKAGKSRSQSAIMAGLACILIINPMLQHQIEIFPTNLLFGIFTGCGIVWLRKLDDPQEVI
jgi:hypothetical protein